MTVIQEPARAADIGVRPVAGHIGADITGVDMSKPLPAGQVAAIRDALHRYKVIFFRGQHLDHETHIAFARQFGELISESPTDNRALAEYPEISTVGQRRLGPLAGKPGTGEPGAGKPGTGEPGAGKPGTGEQRGKGEAARPRLGKPSYFAGWHTDATSSVNPPASCVLRAEVVPEFGGDTTWTNLVAAYEGLSEPVKAFARTLRAEHRFVKRQRGNGGPQRGNGGAAQPAEVYAAIHPVVRVHPVTGEKALFVNPGFTSHIVDVSTLESNAILNLLYSEITRQEYTVRLRWEPGTVAFWDNRATAHLAPGDVEELGVPRTLHRVTIAGDVPVGPDGLESELVSGKPLA
ncbi:MAG: TauD/TfdA family dioxygenase [Nocardiopsaceae bacterium]|nr:TauD/TfdA family dioxygenase [Nocardiopsaceae bacterium]